MYYCRGAEYENTSFATAGYVNGISMQILGEDVIGHYLMVQEIIVSMGTPNDLHFVKGGVKILAKIIIILTHLKMYM